MLEKCSCLMPHKLLSESWHFWILRFCFSWHGTPDACFHCETSLLNQTYKMTLFQLNCLKTLILQLVQASCLMLINHLKCLWQQSQELLKIFREKFQIFQTATRLLKFLWIILNAALFFIFKFIRENKFKCNFWFLVAVINLWTKDTFKTISIAK